MPFVLVKSHVETVLLKCTTVKRRERTASLFQARWKDGQRLASAIPDVLISPSSLIQSEKKTQIVQDNSSVLKRMVAGSRLF